MDEMLEYAAEIADAMIQLRSAGEEVLEPLTVLQENYEATVSHSLQCCFC